MTSLAFVRTAIVSVAAVTWSCASTSDARSKTPPTAATAPAQERGMGSEGLGMMGGMCPMQVQGTTVTATDIEGGVSLDFKTATGNVADLRQRVRRMAEMHEHHGMMMGGMMMPAATASVEDIDGGARITLRPKDTAQLQALREHARMRAKRMASGECPMMSGSQRQMAPSLGSDAGEHEAHHPGPGR